MGKYPEPGSTYFEANTWKIAPLLTRDSVTVAYLTPSRSRCAMLLKTVP